MYTETEQGEAGRKGSLIAAIVEVLLYAAVTAAVVLCYRHAGLSQRGGARWLQNGAYLVMLLLALAAMFRGGRRPRDYGIFFSKPHVQAGIGLALGGTMILAAMLFGRMPTLPTPPVYMVCSQLLVATSEELFWRGFLLTELGNVFGKRDIPVPLTALLFAVSHFPLTFSIGQVIFTFVVGVLFAVFRTEFRGTVGIPALVLAHWVSNLF